MGQHHHRSHQYRPGFDTCLNAFCFEEDEQQVGYGNQSSKLRGNFEAEPTGNHD